MDIRTATFILNLVTVLLLVAIAFGNWNYQERAVLFERVQEFQSRVFALENAGQEKQGMQIQMQPTLSQPQPRK